MVKFRVTKKVRNHRFNDNYDCVVVEFDLNCDTHFQETGSTRFNWLPRDEEAKQLTEYMFDQSPTFRVWLKQFLVNGENTPLASFLEA